MLLETSVEVTNLLIAGLPRKERKRIQDHCEVVDLTFGEVLCDSDKPVTHVYFPVTGFISQLTTIKGHPPLEMGLIGNEGMLGATLILGVNTAPLRAVVQGAGTTFRISTLEFRRALGECPALLRTINRYLYVTMRQLAQTAACNHFHEIEPRLARWLLMTHDRTHSDHFHLTHEFLADMLGVRRSGITVAAGALQSKNLIGYTRGEISILNRSGLKAAACECYEAVNNDYQQQFPLIAG
ncbi:MAG: Crp/Fnr family transcriptional regulator [Arenimonas sp.]